MAFTVTGFLGKDSPAVFDLTLIVNSDHDQAMLDPQRSLPEDHCMKAIIDTGSPQCLLIPGLLANRHFGSSPLSLCLDDAMLQGSDRRGQRMTLQFSVVGQTKNIQIPVYEMQFSSRLPKGYMLLGRTLLDHAQFCYDGPNRITTLTFADNSPVVLR